MKFCKKCENELDDEKFEWANIQHSHRRNVCAKCRNTRKQSLISQNSLRIKQKNLSSQNYRASHPEISILVDSRHSDKRRLRQNDLDLEFIKSQISNPCSYCGETKLRMTLDRVDNSIGHLKSNVVPACIRCNYTRKDMPHKAWLLIADGMRKAREAGAFDNWTGSIWK